MPNRFQERYQSAQVMAHHADISERSNRLRQQSEQLLLRSRATRTISDSIHEKIRKFSLQRSAIR